MRILFNLEPALGQRTGVGHYTAELFRCLAGRAAPDEVIGLPIRWRTLHARVHAAIGRVAGPIRQHKERLLAEAPAAGLLPRLWQGWRHLRLRDRALVAACLAGRFWINRELRRCLRPAHGDLYHEPNHIPLPGELPTIVTIHDLSALLHPEWHPADRVRHFKRRFLPRLRQCSHFLTVSDFTRQEVIAHLGLAPHCVTRVYNGIRPGMRPLGPAETGPLLRHLGLEAGSYFLYVGTLEPRKNVETLLWAYCDLPAALRSRCPLALAGGWGWRAEELRELVEQATRHRGVVHLGYVEEGDLPALYSGARALAYPALYEGFGLPPVEMLACGGAVLAATAAAVAEVLQGSNAHLIEPLDVAAWRDALARAIADDDWLAGLRHGAEQHAARFSWDACADATLRVYRRVVSPRSEPLAA